MGDGIMVQKCIPIFTILTNIFSASSWTHYEKNYKGSCVATGNSESLCPDLGEHAYKGELLDDPPIGPRFFIEDLEPFDEDYFSPLNRKKRATKKKESKNVPNPRTEEKQQYDDDDDEEEDEESKGNEEENEENEELEKMEKSVRKGGGKKKGKRKKVDGEAEKEYEENESEEEDEEEDGEEEEEEEDEEEDDGSEDDEVGVSDKSNDKVKKNLSKMKHKQ